MGVNSPGISVPDKLSEIESAESVYELRFLWFCIKGRYWDYCLVDYKRLAEAVSVQYFFLEAKSFTTK